MDTGIPEKLFFKIGEVAELLSLRPSVLRYWESEFSFLKPNKSRSGQRLYSRRDVELISEIKRLLYSEKLTIEGARQLIGKKARKAVPEDGTVSDKFHTLLLAIKEELKDLRNTL